MCECIYYDDGGRYMCPVCSDSLMIDSLDRWRDTVNAALRGGQSAQDAIESGEMVDRAASHKWRAQVAKHRQKAVSDNSGDGSDA